MGARALLGPALSGFALALACRAPAPAPADIVLLGGRIATVEPGAGEVQALAARDGRIVALGTDAEVERLVGPRTRVLRLAGRRAVPGFVEGHGHLVGLGESLRILDLRGTRSFDEVVALVARAARETAPGEWILGRGWHQEAWERPPSEHVEGFPTHHALSAATPDHPVALTHASGHASLFDDDAMRLAGVDGSTPDPAGGEILRLADGRPSGLFRESAAALVERVLEERLARRSAAERRAELRETVRRAERECLGKGVTSFQDAGASLETVALLREMAEGGELDLRLWVMLRDDPERLRAAMAAARVVGAGDGHLTVRALKRSVDGALGSRGAWLLEPYADSPASTGLATTPIDTLEELAELCVRHDYQLCVHAIGDRANREVLDLVERTLARHPGLGRDHRWRVEHAQHLHPSDVPRFAELGVVASMQPVHCTSDAPWVVARLGEERARTGAYLWRELLDSGALVSAGTDAPVEDVDPIANFRAAVTRRLADGSTFFPAQRMTRAEALEAATLSAARAAFQEHETGSLALGKRADVVVLSRDVLTVPEDEIALARVLVTIVGGRVVHEGPPE